MSALKVVACLEVLVVEPFKTKRDVSLKGTSLL